MLHLFDAESPDGLDDANCEGLTSFDRGRQYSLSARRFRVLSSMTTCHVTIVDAGPYGLSAAAHLRAIKGLEVRVFGQPMGFWTPYMPVGMLLGSNWTATSIADPTHSLPLEA